MLSSGHYVRARDTTHTCAQTRLLNRYDERVALKDS
jgi:hypothetical protein